MVSTMNNHIPDVCFPHQYSFLCFYQHHLRNLSSKTVIHQRKQPFTLINGDGFSILLLFGRKNLSYSSEEPPATQTPSSYFYF